MKTLKRIMLFFAGVSLLIACSKSDGFFGHDSYGNDFRNSHDGQMVDKCGHDFNKGDVFKLSGLALYRTWEVRGGKVWQDASNPCVATLEILDNHNFKFTFTETKPTYSITLECLGKIAASGVLTFKYPVPVMTLPDGSGLNITDIIRGHACATIWGEGINEGTLVFNGKFDGKKLTATAYFMAKVASPCPSNDMFDPALVKGNLWWTFGYALTVD
jgi:hypothetical protein